MKILFFISTHHFTNGYNAHKQRGAFNGKVDADITSDLNTVYSVMGASGSFDINSTGTYRLSGAKNIIYSGLGYSANFNNFKGTGMLISHHQ